MIVPKVGLEPTLPEERDFESRASTNSATLARHPLKGELLKYTHNG